MKTKKARNGKIRIGTFFETNQEQALFKIKVLGTDIFYGQEVGFKKLTGYVVVEANAIYNRNNFKESPFRVKLSKPKDVVVLKNCFSIDGQMITKLNN